MEKDCKEKDVLEDIVDIINNAQLSPAETTELLINLMFSIGSSLSDVSEELTSEKILTLYASEPTVGHALMAQALHMKETWTNIERNVEANDRKDL